MLTTDQRALIGRLEDHWIIVSRNGRYWLEKGLESDRVKISVVRSLLAQGLLAYDGQHFHLQSSPPETPTWDELADRIRALYRHHCANCHRRQDADPSSTLVIRRVGDVIKPICYGCSQL